MTSIYCPIYIHETCLDLQALKTFQSNIIISHSGRLNSRELPQIVVLTRVGEQWALVQQRLPGETVMGRWWWNRVPAQPEHLFSTLVTADLTQK